MEHTLKKYTGIKSVLKHQIEFKSDLRWAWRNCKINEEFVCVYKIIPSWSKELYSAQQLLDKLNES
tara:strand:+ start:38 stop:235 length:198 start_codon:yes stop_codon:yes gene_type:complete